MKVTYLLSDLGGGTGHHLLDLLATRSPDLWQAEIVSEVPSTSRMALPVDHLILETPSGPAFYPIRQIQRYRQLARLFRSGPIEVLHTYFFWSIIYGRLLKRAGIVSRLVENREDLGFDWGPVEYGMLAATRHLPDRVICVGEAVREVVLEREGLPPERVEVVRNGIVLEAATTDPRLAELRRELGLAPENLVVTMVANFDRPIKGVRHFLDAVPRIRAEVPEARFILLGQGKTAGDLKLRAQALGIDDVFLMPGFREDVHRFYALTDLSVLTSLSEGLSITILESMRHGVPVVVTNVGGNRELVRDGRTGILVEPAKPAVFADAVVSLLRDARRRERFGVAARRVILEEFDMRHAVLRYGEIYSQTVADSSQAPHV